MLQVAFPNGRSKVPPNSYLLWLATDRNYIPMRHEWREPHWSERLPTGIKSVDAWQELAPGVWHPQHVTLVSHEKSAEVDLATGHIVRQWHKEYTITRASLEAEPLAEPNVPKGTKVQVQNEEGKIPGRISPGGRWAAACLRGEVS